MKFYARKKARDALLFHIKYDFTPNVYEDFISNFLFRMWKRLLPFTNFF